MVETEYWNQQWKDKPIPVQSKGDQLRLVQNFFERWPGHAIALFYSFVVIFRFALLCFWILCEMLHSIQAILSHRLVGLAEGLIKSYLSIYSCSFVKHPTFLSIPSFSLSFHYIPLFLHSLFVFMYLYRRNSWYWSYRQVWKLPLIHGEEYTPCKLRWKVFGSK